MRTRMLGFWEFEGGAILRIALTGDIPTEYAIDMAQTLLALKRAEMADKRSAVSAGFLNVCSGADGASGDNGLSQRSPVDAKP